MVRGNVTITYRQISDWAGAIDIQGELTAFAENELMEVYNLASSHATTRAILLNFTQMEYMTSSGIGLLVTLFIRANRQGKRIYAVGLNDHFQHIFYLTKLNETIPVFNTEDEALKTIQVT